MQVFDQIPGGKSADGVQGFAAPHQTRATREHGIRGVACEHRSAIEEGFAIAKRITRVHSRVFDGLDISYITIRFNLPNAVAQEVWVGHLIVSITRLDEGDVW